jgi:hypothetical protein
VVAVHGKSFFESAPVFHDCTVCKRDEVSREEWGCDAPTEDPQFTIPCVYCNQVDPECESCGGDGWEHIHRCPYSVCDEVTWELMALYRSWPGTMHSSGGVYEQHAGYLNAMRVIDVAMSRMDKLIKDEQERRMKSGRSGKT